MKKSFFLSLLLHFFIILLAIFGLPEIIIEDKNENKIGVSIINQAELEPEKKPEKEKLTENKTSNIKDNRSEITKPLFEKEKLTENKTSNIEDNRSEITKPLFEKKPIPIKKPVPIKKPIPIKKPVPIKKLISKPEKKESLRSDLDKTKKLTSFDDMLKNLSAEDLDDSNLQKEKTIDKATKAIKKLADSSYQGSKVFAEPGEISKIQNLIYNQIDSKWSRPPAMKSNKKLSVTITIFLDASGNLINFIVDDLSYKRALSDNSYRPFLESALRALKRSSPFNGLDQDRYSLWKKIIINFTPIEASN